MSDRSFDVLVVGSGAAGLTAAHNLATRLKVGVIAKGGLHEGATGWAQGGIAAVLEEGDSFEAHVRDTMIAGAGLNNLSVVEHFSGGTDTTFSGSRRNGALSDVPPSVDSAYRRAAPTFAPSHLSRKLMNRSPVGSSATVPSMSWTRPVVSCSSNPVRQVAPWSSL